MSKIACKTSISTKPLINVNVMPLFQRCVSAELLPLNVAGIFRVAPREKKSSGERLQTAYTSICTVRSIRAQRIRLSNSASSYNYQFVLLF